MNALFILTISTVVGISIYLILCKDMFRIVMGLAMLAAAVNLILFLTARPNSMIAPLIPYDGSTIDPLATQPLAQALTLTAIVIGLALMLTLMLMMLRIRATQKSSDVSRFQLAEPQSMDKASKPSILEE